MCKPHVQIRRSIYLITHTYRDIVRSMLTLVYRGRLWYCKQCMCITYYSIFHTRHVHTGEILRCKKHTWTPVRVWILPCSHFTTIILIIKAVSPSIIDNEDDIKQVCFISKYQRNIMEDNIGQCIIHTSPIF